MKSKKQKWNWLDGLTKRNKPAGITQIKKHNMPDWADSYVYKLSSKKLNKTYIGYHKENGKTYYGSPTDKELILLISDSNSDLVFEIVEYGSKLEMMQLEHELLVEADARNNPNYWNKTNGQSGVPKFNREAINKIVKIVKSGGDEYLGEPMFPIDLSEITKNQVREVEYDIDNLNTIIDAIIRNQGSTEKAKPPVILEDRLYEGIEQDTRIGGAHTIESYCRTKWKNIVKLTPIRIPKELHKDITDDGLTLLGDLLNAREEISSPATHEDGTKYLLKVRQSGRSWKSPDVRTDLFDMGLSSSKVRTAYENADKVVDNETMVGKGYVVKDYVNKKEHKQELEDKITEVETHEPDAFVGSSSSAAITWDRIFGRYDEDKKPQHTRIHWIVYNTSRKRQDETWPKLKTKLLKLNRKYGKPIGLTFEELPLYTKEVSKN